MTAPTTEKPVVRRPGTKRPNGSGRKGKRSFDVEDDLWFEARDAAHEQGISLASVLCAALEDFVAASRADA